MTTLEDPVDQFIPASILQGTRSTRRLWLHEQVKAILKKYVMDDQEQFHQSLRDEIIETRHYGATVHLGVVVVELINCKCGGIVRNQIW